MSVIIKIFCDGTGKEPFIDWLESIKDIATQARVREKLRRIELGNFGDHKSIGDGIYEIRMHFGSGYRVYYGKVGKQIILLLSDGDKHSQKQNIKQAKHYWYAYKKTALNKKI